MEAGGNTEEVIAALLHDVIEDCEDIEREDVAKRFGERVAEIVDALSDASAKAGEEKPDWKPRKQAYLAHLDACDDSSILLVSNADKLHNARCILSDLQDPEIGSKVWDRFSSSVKDTIWYYESLTRIFTDKAVCPRLACELSKVVEEIKRHA
jgi:(p)ppGpp synthase/HD superfamily hydrolase